MRGIKLKKIISFSLFIILFNISLGTAVYGMNITMPKENDYSELERYIKDEMKSSLIPGAAVSIIKNNKVVYSKGYGIADSKGKKVNPYTSFSICSISKTFAAVAAMQLVERGKIALAAPIEKYIPWVKISIPAGAPKITVKNLLSHTSGISADLGQNIVIGPKSENIKELILKQKEIKAAKPAGQSWEYSNLNFILIGAIIESVSGESYADYLKENILIPLEMNNTYLTKDEILNGNSATGFQTVFGKLVPFDYPYRNDCLSVGWIYTNTEDMTHYMSMLLNGGKYKDKSILSPESIETIETPVIYTQSSGYGLGIFIGNGICYHGGDDSNFHAFMVLNPANKDGAIMMCNTNSYLAAYGQTIYNKLFHVQSDRPETNMDKAMIDTIMGNKSYNFVSINIKKLYIVFDTIYAIILVYLSVSIYMIKYWKKRILGKSRLKIVYIIWSIIINIIIPITGICDSIINANTWISFYHNEPDLAYGSIFIAYILLVIGIIKICIILSAIKFKKVETGNKYTN